MMRISVFGVLLLLSLASNALAQEQTQAAQQGDQPITHEEHIVVTASRRNEDLVNAPATISIISTETIESAPSTNIAELLRAVPGVNVIQMSARDFNLTGRAATGTLATSQLALVDGRTIYLDFFGMVMWDLVPSVSEDVKQIEMIRGPASAVWGANAMTGVVNVITKTPRELAAESAGTVTIAAGTFDRNVTGRSQDRGTTFSIDGAHAGVINDRWAYKASAGFLTQDPLPRPAGTIPNASHTLYPDFTNAGTTQPRVDGRLDYEAPDQTRWSFSGGVAGTEGVIHTGIGPFNIARGARLGYVSARYGKGGRHVGFFTNLLNGNASNLLTVGPAGAPIRIDFVTRTFDVEAGDVAAITSRHLLSYGGNYRRNTFDFSLAPNGGDRNEGGGYVQDEIFLATGLRWVIGGRLDKSTSVAGVVFSPRTALLIKPLPSQTIRLSFNRAFRAPSYVNNNIDSTIINQLDLGLIVPQLAGVLYTFPIRAIGNTDLKEETLTAYEIGYTADVFRGTTVTAAVYWNKTEDGIFFTQATRYGASNPPPGWPLPLSVLEILAAAGSGLPATFTYRNLSPVTDKGIEMGIDGRVTNSLDAFANYSYQSDPDGSTLTLAEVNFAPNHRFNIGMRLNNARWLGNVSLNHTSRAFWNDVLDARFHGPTNPYTLLNGAFGRRWHGGKVTTSVKGTNLLNREVMQHVFSDVLRRQIGVELRVKL